jgi:xylulokinase
VAARCGGAGAAAGPARRHPVAGGGGDNAASACGMGCFDMTGTAFVSLGTSGVLFRRQQPAICPIPRQRRACLLPRAAGHLAPDGRDPVGDRFAQLAGRASPATKPAALTRRTGRHASTARATIRFLPYLGGERTPHNDASIRGVLPGSATSDRAQGADACGARRRLPSPSAIATKRLPRPAPAERLLAIGGGSKSDYWLRLIATVLGLPVDLPEAAISAPPSAPPGSAMMARRRRRPGAESARRRPSPEASNPTAISRRL